MTQRHGIQAVGLFSLLLFTCGGITETGAAKILLYPLDAGFNSRALNFGKLTDFLHQDGHQVSIIMNQELLDRFVPKHAKIIKYELPEDIPLVTDPDVVAKFQILMNSYFALLNVMDFWGRISAGFCESLVSDKPLMEKMKQENYDLLIVDQSNECSRLVVDYLDIPTIIYVNHGFHPNDLVYPRIPSFTCDSFSAACLSDEMTFSERLFSFLNLISFECLTYPTTLSHFRALRHKYNLNTSLDIHFSPRYKTSLIIANVDFVLEFPRALMPNVFPISGLYIREPNPLPTDLAEFVNESKYDGIVVVSFGTLVDKVTADRAEIMARVFSKLPALVIWRFTGVPPKDLGKNTKLVGWFPQFDVLAHPKTKLFVTHCGVSASFEAAYLGIPVVALPMLADQLYHASQLTNRLKLGVISEWTDFKEDSFEKDVLHVFGNPTYVRNAKKVSALMNDKPIPPKQEFLFLVNYTIRHGGAEHLISRPSLELSNLQFYSVDVIAFLLLILAVVLVVIFLSCKLSAHLLCRMKSRKTKVN